MESLDLSERVPAERMERGYKMDRLIARGEEILIFIMVMYTTIIVFLNVITRYVFYFTIMGADTTATWSLVMITYIACSYGIREKGHFAIDMIYRLFPSTEKFITTVITGIMGAIFSIFLLIYGIKFVIFSRIDIAPDIPKFHMYYIYSIIPIAGLLMTYRFIALIIQGIKK
jgi:C4-dicarboxylate transporter, DctQ subunit